MDKLLEHPCEVSGGGKGRNINLFQTACKAKTPVVKKPVEIPEILIHYQQQAKSHKTEERRKFMQNSIPNIIGNQSDEDEV